MRLSRSSLSELDRGTALPPFLTLKNVVLAPCIPARFLRRSRLLLLLPVLLLLLDANAVQPPRDSRPQEGRKADGNGKGKGGVAGAKRDHINALGLPNDGYDYDRHLKSMGEKIRPAVLYCCRENASSERTMDRAKTTEVPMSRLYAYSVCWCMEYDISLSHVVSTYLLYDWNYVKKPMSPCVSPSRLVVFVHSTYTRNVDRELVM